MKGCELVKYTQEKLIEKAQRGDRKALELLLKEMYGQLYKTAFIYMKNEQDALDVVQETAFKVTAKIHTLKEKKYFKTWVIKILIRTAFDLLEKNKKNAVDYNDDQLSETAELSDIATGNTDRETYSTLIEAMHQLKLTDQQLIGLYYFNELSIREIADLLLCPEGTVKYNLHRARKQLKNMLEGME